MGEEILIFITRVRLAFFCKKIVAKRRRLANRAMRGEISVSGAHEILREF
jgi:hypothetical protein